MPRRSLALLMLMLCVACAASAQVSATSAVVITAKMPGSITLSLQSTPVFIPVQNGAQQPFEVPLTVQWNLDPRETPGFGVQAYFLDSGSALVNPSSATRVPAADLVARWGQGSFQPFSSGDAKVELFRTSVLPELRHGNESRTLELRISDPVLSNLPDGQYQGVLYLEVKNY